MIKWIPIWMIQKWTFFFNLGVGEGCLEESEIKCSERESSSLVSKESLNNFEPIEDTAVIMHLCENVNCGAAFHSETELLIHSTTCQNSQSQYFNDEHNGEYGVFFPSRPQHFHLVHFLTASSIAAKISALHAFYYLILKWWRNWKPKEKSYRHLLPQLRTLKEFQHLWKYLVRANRIER